MSLVLKDGGAAQAPYSFLQYFVIYCVQPRKERLHTLLLNMTLLFADYPRFLRFGSRFLG
jgi:hypothetical protein